MISGGNATVYVSNMDAAVQFYTETLGLTLTNRFGQSLGDARDGPCYWSEEGAGLTIGLHPVSPKHPAPGTAGGSRLRPRNLQPLNRCVARCRSAASGSPARSSATKAATAS